LDVEFSLATVEAAMDAPVLLQYSIMNSKTLSASAQQRETHHSGSLELAGNDVYCGRHTYMFLVI
jgi:hypothetical protein